MKFIDSKGRLFGWCNVIDFLAVIFILSLSYCLYLGYKIFIKPYPPSLPQINWEQKYDEEVAQKERVFEEYPRLRKYFK